MSASAATVQAAGVATSPAQPYLANPNTTDWLGSYTVGTETAFATEFGMNSPDQAEAVAAPAAVVTKWGTSISPSDSALLAYLLWRYGDTTDADEASALAHIIFSKLSAPQNPAQLSPANDFRHIAYDAPFHLAKLPLSSQALVTSMLATSTDVMGPWTIDLTPPSSATIGTASDWSLRILGAGGVAVPSVPVQVTVTDATLAGGATTLSLTTPSNGSPLLIPVTPTGSAPSMTVDADAPRDEALSVDAVTVDVSPLLIRSNSVTALTGTVTGTAAAAPAAGPILAVTGSQNPPWLAGSTGLAAILAGAALVLVSERPRRRRAHRA